MQSLDIDTEIIISSSIDIDHMLKSQSKVLAICKNLSADAYVNPIGGQNLYAADAFRNEGIELRFIKPGPVSYTQYTREFVPNLSIIDVLAFNSPEEIRQMLKQYTSI